MAAPIPQPEEVSLTAEQALQQITDECANLTGKELRTRLRQLQLSWHPDHAWRRGIESAVACRVFIYVQELWEREAKEVHQRVKVTIT